MIIGVYIALPFVANAIKNIETKALSVPLILLFVIVFIFGLYSQLKSVFGWSFQISGVIDISFLGGTYGMYIFFGALCKRGVFKKIPSPVLWLFIAAGTVLCVWLLTYSIRIGNSIRLWYDFPGVLLASCSIFELFSRMDCTQRQYPFQALAHFLCIRLLYFISAMPRIRCLFTTRSKPLSFSSPLLSSARRFRICSIKYPNSIA